MTAIISRQQGKKAVRIEPDPYEAGGAKVSTVRNGFQWTGFYGDRELLVMLRDALTEFLDVEEPSGERSPNESAS
jgi:hypothetical protein